MEVESTSTVVARGVTSAQLKTLDQATRRQGFVGFGKLIIGGFVMQFDYRTIRKTITNKITRLPIDGSKGSDLKNRGSNEPVVEIACHFSGFQKQIYREALERIVGSEKAQPFISEEAVFNVVIDRVSFRREEFDVIEWDMTLRQHIVFPAFIEKQSLLSQTTSIIATATTTAENVVRSLTGGFGVGI